MHMYITSRLDTPLLLESFFLHVPTRSTRNRHLFFEPRARVNTIQRGMFCRLPRLANSFQNCPRGDCWCVQRQFYDLQESMCRDTWQTRCHRFMHDGMILCSCLYCTYIVSATIPSFPLTFIPHSILHHLIHLAFTPHFILHLLCTFYTFFLSAFLLLLLLCTLPLPVYIFYLFLPVLYCYYCCVF